MIDEVEPMQGSRELIIELKQRGHTVVLASSAKAEEAEHYVDLLDARKFADGWTTSADVRATKPEPALVSTAIERAAGSSTGAVMVGDTWDARAARAADIPTLAVRTGGFGVDELAGAVEGVESVAELCSRLAQTLLR